MNSCQIFGFALVLFLYTQLAQAAPRLICTADLTNGSTSKTLQCESALNVLPKVKLVELKTPCSVELGDFYLFAEIKNLTVADGTQPELEMSIHRNVKTKEPKLDSNLVHSWSMPLPAKNGALNSQITTSYLRGYEYTTTTFEKIRYTRIDSKCRFED